MGWPSAPGAPPRGGRPRRAGGLLLMLGMLVVLAGVVYVAVTRLPTGSLSRPGATTSTAASRPAAPAAAAGAPADATTQQSVQQVIQNLDDAQAQAIASNDPNVMAATAMPSFYAEEVAANQDLVDSGVTEVKLLKAEWGQVTIDSNNTATVTVYETWSTTFQDGTTQQARDRNIYTLVQDN